MLSVVMLNVIMMSDVFYLLSSHAKFRYAECHNTEYRYAEYRGAK